MVSSVSFDEVPTDPEEQERLANKAVAEFQEQHSPTQLQQSGRKDRQSDSTAKEGDTSEPSRKDSEGRYTEPSLLVDRDSLETETEPGLSFTTAGEGQQFDSYAPTRVHRELFHTGSELALSVVGATYDIADGMDAKAFRETLEATEIDSILGGLVTTLAVETAKLRTDSACQLVRLGSRLGGNIDDLNSTRGDIERFVSLFELSAVTPTVRVELGHGFRQTRNSQQRATLGYLLALSQGANVVLVGSDIDRRYLSKKFGELLPSSVTDSCNDRRGSLPTDELLTTVGVDSVSVDLLKRIADSPNGSIGYNRLKRAFSEYDRTTVSRYLNANLVANGLVEIYGERGSKRVDVLPAGDEYLTYLDELNTVEKGGSETVSETPKRSNNTVCKHDSDSGGREGNQPDRKRYRLPYHHTVEYLSWPETVAPSSATTETDVCLTNYPVEFRSDRAQGEWGYIQDSNELVASVEYTNPMQFMVTLARTLSDTRTFDHVLTDERLNQLTGPIQNGVEFLRGVRNLGYLPNDIDSGTEFGEQLQQERDNLLDLTRDLSSLEGEEHRRLRGKITKKAHGLAGTMLHVFDLLGIEVVREVRLPEFSRRFDREDAMEVAATMAHHVSIASRYNQSVPYRLLYEQRTDKRSQSIGPRVDPANQLGEILGRISLVGEFGNRVDEFKQVLESRLSEPYELHDEAPDIAIRTTVATGHSRSTISSTVRQMCSAKSLEATREAVSLFGAFAQTPYDITQAIHAGLKRENQSGEIGREIRVAEVRRALATLPPSRLLNGEATPGVRAMTKALLETQTPLTRSELADRADISTQTVRNHLDVLLGSGIAKERNGKIRLSLSFNTDEERHTDRIPLFMHDEKTFARDIVFEVFESLGELTETVMDVWIAPDGVPNVRQLSDSYGWLTWLVPLIESLTTERPDNESVRTVAFGSDSVQPKREITTIH